MVGQLSPDQRFACEEKVVQPGGIFETASRFLPPEQADRALAFEALFASVRDIPLQSSDPGVAMAKLGWWQSEIARADSEGSQHPIVQALLAADALADLSADLWTGYIAGVATGIDASPPGSVGELMPRLDQQSGLEAVIMLGWSEDDPRSASARSAGSRYRLLSLLMALSHGGNPSWLPMDLLARESVRPPGDGENIDDVAAGRLAAALIDSVGTQARDSWPMGDEAVSHATPGLRYLAIREALVRRWLSRISRNPGWLTDSRGGRCSLADQWTAWRVSRRWDNE